MNKKLIGPGLMVISLALVIVAMAIDKLSSAKIAKTTYYYGWKSMKSSGGGFKAEVLQAALTIAPEEEPDMTTSSNYSCTYGVMKKICNGGRVWIAFNIIGMLVLISHLGISYMRYKSDSSRFYWLSVILAATAALCSLVAVATWSSQGNENIASANISWSSVLVIIALLLEVGCVAVALFIEKRDFSNTISSPVLSNSSSSSLETRISN